MRRTLLLLGLAGLTLACGEGERQPVVRDEAPEVSVEEGRPSSDTEEAAVLFLGTSLTAGYGLASEEAYPALIQEKIDSAGLEFRVVNAGVSGETSAGGLRRIDWLLRQPVAALVIELGANDMLRGHDTEAMRANLQEIIDRTRAAHPRARIVIAGMRAAPNLGEPYASEFESSFPELARRNDAALIPFLLRDVAAVPELNQPDGIHPTAEGQRIVAENVWRVLEPVLRAIESRSVTDGDPRDRGAEERGIWRGTDDGVEGLHHLLRIGLAAGRRGGLWRRAGGGRRGR